MGGMLAVTNAAASHQVDATVAFYGMPRDLSVVERSRARCWGYLPSTTTASRPRW